MKTNITSKVETVTPQLAELWLKSNTGNRRMSPKHVTMLADEIVAGRWKVDGAAIRFADTGRLLDGQHRLHAIIEANEEVNTLVVRGLSEDVFGTIDRSKARKAADSLRFLGESNCSALAGSLAFVSRYFGKTMDHGRAAPSPGATMELLEDHPEIRISVSRTCGSRYKLIPPSAFAGLHYLFSYASADLADEWCDGIKGGFQMDKGCPFYLLRERLIVNASSHAKLIDADIARLCITAWNYKRGGEKVSRVHLSTGQFPTIL